MYSYNNVNISRQKRDKQRLFYNKTSIFAIFSKTSTRWYYFEIAIIFSFSNSTSWQNIEKLTWILLYLAAVWLKKIGAIFVHFSTLMSAIYRFFIYVWDDNITFVVLFQNLDNLKTNTTKIPVLVLQKLSLLDSSFLDCFIRKIATICSIPWFPTCYISKSSTRWHIFLFIVSSVLP